MAAGDDFIFGIVQKVVLTDLCNTTDTVQYRQDIIKDCFSNMPVIKALYKLCISIVEKRKGSWLGIFTSRPSSILWDAISMMRLSVDMLKQLRKIADEHAGDFKSEGFTVLFDMIKHELPDNYFSEIENHLEELRFKDGILVSAQLGEGNKALHYVLHKAETRKKRWWKKIFKSNLDNYYFDIHPRDDSGVRMLTQLKDQAINIVANVLAQSNDHIISFFNQLQTELAFYIGCMNLQEQLSYINEPFCFPGFRKTEERIYEASGLYDISLALNMQQKIIDNNLYTGAKNLILITGANQGGKSTFLRSIGLAQLMMRAGMFVAAGSFSTNLASQVFTHFKREEDNKMKSGKLDEELSRMDEIITHITPDTLLLFNESFAATNEREGSEIAIQIVTALVEKNFTIFFVTHLYQFAHHFFETAKEKSVFLLAERQDNRNRTFKLKEGKPLPTSYGIDLYNKIFGEHIMEK
jgi:DNA mismatch repair ATPase MutS